MNGWLVHFKHVTVWIQSASSHVAARHAASRRLYEQFPDWSADRRVMGSTQIRNGKPGPRRPA